MDQQPHRLTTIAYGRLLEGALEQAAGYALSILRNRADAEDAVQQAALRGLERLHLYTPRHPFKGWWFVVLRNCCVDMLRARRPHAHLDETRLQAADQADTSDWQDLAEALERLESQQAEILRLRYFAGLSYKEISLALAIPQGTVMSRLHYARLALADQMKDARP